MDAVPSDKRGDDWPAQRARISKLVRSADERIAASKRVSEAPWEADLVCNKRGPVDCVRNAVLILERDPAFKGRLRNCELRTAAIARELPWRPGSEWREWSDTDDVELANWAQERGVPLRPNTCAQGVALVASHNSSHPIREYLERLKWDGTPRLGDWLFTYFGAHDAPEEYIRAVGRAWMVGAVARVYQPGAKVDYALILEGLQGRLKSTSIAALAHDPAWFTDQIADLGTKDSAPWLDEEVESLAAEEQEARRIPDPGPARQVADRAGRAFGDDAKPRQNSWRCGWRRSCGRSGSRATSSSASAASLSGPTCARRACPLSQAVTTLEIARS